MSVFGLYDSFGSFHVTSTKFQKLPHHTISEFGDVSSVYKRTRGRKAMRWGGGRDRWLILHEMTHMLLSPVCDDGFLLQVLASIAQPSQVD